MAQQSVSTSNAHDLAGLRNYLLVAVALGFLFGCWAVHETAIDRARTCPQSCLRPEVARVVDAETEPAVPDRHSGGLTRTRLTLDLHGQAGRTEISVPYGTVGPAATEVPVRLWRNTIIQVNGTDVHPGWQTPTRFVTVILLFPVFAFCTLKLASRLVLLRGLRPQEAGRQTRAGSRGVLRGTFVSSVVAVGSMVAVGSVNGYPAWWPALALGAGLLVSMLCLRRATQRAAANV
ncbi:hypothetical protein AB0J90_16365 [Micromonospora sp. NPDC049523]|uniref:hypothetical protein n=1 Tax=Micromonospora sp. NPDC049523 TaxID=3155921 RepID=UPI00343B33E2